MNVVKILLVLGLGYVALNQKVEKTRNMLLVVTGLLAFCMFSLEGFTDITFTSGAGAALSATATAAERFAAGGTIIGNNGGTYTFPAAFIAGTGSPTWTCGDSKIPGPVNTSARNSADNSTLTADNINSVFPCVTGGTCPSTAPATNQCGPVKKFKSTTNVTYTGSVGGDDYKAKCCETDTTQCTPDSCNTLNWFGLNDCPEEGSCGQKCENGLFMDTYCDP